MTSDAKRHKSIPSYRINVYAIAPKHPLGVKPSGNALLLPSTDTRKGLRETLLGDFAIFPEELLIELLSYISNPSDLKNLGHCSRILYAYAYSEDYWRNIYLKEYKRLEMVHKDGEIAPFGISSWKGSWRKTVLGIKNESLVQANHTIFSDLLYRPFQCSHIDYPSLFSRVIDIERRSSELCHTLNSHFGIERFRESSFTVKDFQTKYINRPFILQDDSNSDRWPKWDFHDLLKLFPNDHFRQEAVQWNLSRYLEYAINNHDESPLYLFDCNGAPMEKISREYETPAIFKDDAFKLFDSERMKCRPDHRWLIAGPARSGSTFHKDPNQTSAWNVVLSGMKLWIMLPPDVNVPGVSTDKQEEEVTAPVGISEWILSGFYNDAVELATIGQCLIGVTFPGECLYVPSGWWHSVINLTDCVAITENFVPTPLLDRVLSFLKNKPLQISGFHLKDVAASVESFLGNLKEQGDLTILNNNLQILERFLGYNGNKEYDNEDCGLRSESEIIIPIYEFFVELLRRSEFKEEAEKVVSELERLCQDRAAKSAQKSKTWNKLKEGNNQAFSFGFLVD